MKFLRIKITIIFFVNGIGSLLATNFNLIAETLACNDTINISLNSNCKAQLSPDILLEAPDTAETYQIFITFPTDSTGNYKYNGTDSVRLLKTGIFKYSVVDSLGRNCWGYIKAENKLAPIFTAIPRDTIVNCDIELTEAGICATKPTANDDCDSVEVEFISAYIEVNSFPCDTSIIASLWKAIDNHGNFTVDTQRTVYVRPTLNQIISPEDIILSCGEDELSDLEDLNKTGKVNFQTGKIVNSTFIPKDTIVLEDLEVNCGYAISKTDIVKSSACETKITRYWKVLDWCNPSLQTSIIDTQIILYTDTLAPTFLAHENENILNAKTIELGQDCQFDFDGPFPIATDNCDSMPTVEMYEVAQLIDSVWTPIGTNVATLNLAADTFRLGYRAFDNCYNNFKEDTTYTYLITRDLHAPAVICINDLVISLGENNGAILAAEMVDGGSIDACGLITKEIRRKGVDTVWQTAIELPCELVDSQIMVELRIRDAVGNENICWTYVRIEDKVRPICQPLLDTMVNCQVIQSNDFGQTTDDNHNNTFDESEWRTMTDNQVNVYNTTFGDPVCRDNINCKTYTIEQAYQRLELDCREGIIKRRYRSYDSQGNTGTWLEQQITVKYEANWAITFGPDWEGNCNDTIPAPFINIQNGACENLSVNITEKRYEADEDYCLKVERIYQVINNCLFDANTIPLTVQRRVDSTGKVLDSLRISSDSLATQAHFIYKQILIIRSTENPSIVINDVEVCMEEIHTDTLESKSGNNCRELRTFFASATDCIGNEVFDFNWNFYEIDSLIASGTGSTFSMFVLPNIDYNVQFIATDHCNNQTIATKVFNFQDCATPTLFTRTGITLELREKMAEIWAVDFDKGSYDNCTSNEILQQNFRIWHQSLGIAPSNISDIKDLPTNFTFTCANLANQEVFIYVFDEAGNYDRVEAFVIIQDNQESCLDNRLIRLGGQIINEKGEEIEAVNVILTGTMHANELTETDGKYLFNLPSGYQYAVRPYKSENPLNGVTTFDVILISKHILGLAPFISPYQRIAADVNKSGTITAFDLVQLRQLILNIIPDFPNNQSWRFVDAKYAFTSANPENEPFLEAVFFEEMNREIMDMDFIGIKIGDINPDSYRDAKTNTALSAQERTTATSFHFQISDQLIEEGEKIDIPLIINDLDLIDGIQFNFNYLNFEIIEIEEGLAKSAHFSINSYNKNSLTLSWNKANNTIVNQNLLTLKLKAKSKGMLSELLKIDKTKMPAEAYFTNGEIKNIGLQFIKPSSNDKQFELFQNKPNPFKGETSISFYLPKDEKVSLRIMDIQGRIVKIIEGNFAKGFHEISINKEALKTVGILYYQLTTLNYSQTKKMIVMD